MGFVKDTVDSFTGRGGRDAAREAGDIQARSTELAIQSREQAAERAQGFFEPLQPVADRGIAGSSFLANPQEQFDFIQNNPFFDLALENANQQTLASAASRNRLSAGDTFESLANNVLLSSQPLIDRQRQDVTNLLNVGTQLPIAQANIETGQAAGISDLITSGGAARAAGVVGAQNALNQGTQNIIDLGSKVASAFVPTP